MNPIELSNNFCYFLLGMVVTLGGIWFTHVKNAVTRNDLAAVMKGIASDVTQLKVDVAVLKAGRHHE